MTFSHPWGSAPASQIVRGMFGIKPLQPGFKKFQVKLQPGNIAKASLKTPTAKGTIAASYQKANANNVYLDVTIPANTTARVSLPQPTDRGNAKLLVDQVQVTAKQKQGYLTVELGSGRHSLNTDLTQANQPNDNGHTDTTGDGSGLNSNSNQDQANTEQTGQAHHELK
ncbi:alpha-L-rhamnosidase C-terminal domain-containing protein [Agrilactobacillus fermenti]|uniref:alpha-L-rhamnosidase C-terminal domain-containing protein n=2 Tax=Agrilactobacillus fermenti TaxID=2586909 RepID=UPI003A5C0C3C